MLCDECKKNQACVHLTQIGGAEKIERHLCEACAKKYGELLFSSDQKFSVNDFLAGIFSGGAAEAPPVKELICPECGMTYQDFSRTGKIGCGVCYTTFAERLEPLLRRIHGASSHTGKAPRRNGGEIECKHRIAAMRKALKRHVENEEYEQAAQLRDQIKALECQLQDRE